MKIYDKIKNDISQRYYQENFSNDGQRFVAWYLRTIHRLDELEAAECVTDGPNDKKIDAVYINDQDETIYIIQGKFYNQSGKVDPGPFMDIIGAWLNIKDLRHIQATANEKLSAKVKEISSALDDDYEVCFELITTAAFSKSVLRDIESFMHTMASENNMNSNIVRRDNNINTNIVLVDSVILEIRYKDAFDIKRPGIDHTFNLEGNRYICTTIQGTKTVTAILKLEECINIPGIQDGSLFRKNVRQSLGKGVKVNRDIAATLRNYPGNFFFLNNGITAICSSIEVDDKKNIMTVRDINVVNGCQSLTAIYNNSEYVKKSSETGYIIFRFYEVNSKDQADNISVSTNSQNTVKARDLRSNDPYVLAMKKAYEQFFYDGQFITKRGERASAGKNKDHIVELGLLGKLLITWHSQKPTETPSESHIFRAYFDTLFHRNYSPKEIQALMEIYRAVMSSWDISNPAHINFSKSLLVLVLDFRTQTVCLHSNFRLEFGLLLLI